MKVVFVTTWDEACGIATYSANLIEALTDIGVDVEVYKNTADFYGLIRLIRNTDADVIHFQHEFGINPPTEPLLSIFGKARARGIKVIVTPHSETDHFNVLLDGVADAVILHSDSKEMALKNSFSSFYKIPHGVPKVSFRNKKEFYRKKYGIPANAFVIGTCGFIQNRGMENIVTALSDFAKEHEDVYIHLAVSAHKKDEGKMVAKTLFESLKNQAARKGYLDRFHMNMDFMPVEEFRERIYTFDVGFGYAPAHFISNSGMATDIVSCGVPMVVNDAPHFNHVFDCSTVVPAEDSFDDVATAIKHLYEHRDELTALAEKAEVVARSLSFENVAALHKKVYENSFEKKLIRVNVPAVISEGDTITYTSSSNLWEFLLVWPKLKALVDLGYKIRVSAQNDGLTDMSLVRYMCGVEDVVFEDVGLQKSELLFKVNSNHLSTRLSADVAGLIRRGRVYSDILPFIEPAKDIILNLGDYAKEKALKETLKETFGLGEVVVVAVEESSLDNASAIVDWVSQYNNVIVMGAPLNKDVVKTLAHVIEDRGVNKVSVVIEDVRTQFAVCAQVRRVFAALGPVLSYCLLNPSVVLTPMLNEDDPRWDFLNSFSNSVGEVTNV